MCEWWFVPILVSFEKPRSTIAVQEFNEPLEETGEVTPTVYPKNLPVSLESFDTDLPKICSVSLHRLRIHMVL